MALLASTLITDLQDQIGTLDATGQGVLLKFIQRAVDYIYQYRRWSWRRLTDQFTTNAPYTTGTVTASAGSTSVTGSGSTWTSISGYATGTFYLEVNDEIHLIASIDSDTGLTLAAGVDTALSGDTYSIYTPVYYLDSTLAELTYIGTDSHCQIEVLPPGEAFQWHHQEVSRSYARYASLTKLDSSKNRGIALWPFPSERRVYTYTGFIEPPTLQTTTDVGTPDDFRDAIEELTLSRWWRRRDDRPDRAQQCYISGKNILDQLWLVDPKDDASQPFMGNQWMKGRGVKRDFRWANEYGGGG